MKKQLYRAAAATVLGLSLTTGVVAADTGGINTTGPDSYNSIHSHRNNRVRVTNNNDVDVSNRNDQSAYSGRANVSHNTWGGDATSGDASNKNQTSADISIDNSASSNAGSDFNHGHGGGGGGSIQNTGPDSSNRIDTSVNNTLTIKNDNDISIHNTNDQRATTGSANVSGNTHGGDATSGDAYNSNSSSFTISVTN